MFLIGIMARKPVKMCIKSNVCISKRQTATAQNSLVHHLSWGQFWCNGSWRLAVNDDCFVWHCNLECIVTNDNSTMKACMKWSNKHHKEFYGSKPMTVITKGPNKEDLKVWDDTGKLPSHTLEPLFLADRAHRKRTPWNHLHTYKGLYKMANHVRAFCQQFAIKAWVWLVVTIDCFTWPPFWYP